MDLGWSLVTPRTRHRLAWGAAAAVTLPWLLGSLFKQFHQPGLSADPQREALLIDYIVIGGIVSGLMMLAVVAVGCWVVAVLKGPRRHGDRFPSET